MSEYETVKKMIKRYNFLEGYRLFYDGHVENMRYNPISISKATERDSGFKKRL
jgi:hypothetical protein